MVVDIVLTESSPICAFVGYSSTCSLFSMTHKIVPRRVVLTPLKNTVLAIMHRISAFYCKRNDHAVGGFEFCSKL